LPETRPLSLPKPKPLNLPSQKAFLGEIRVMNGNPPKRRSFDKALKDAE